VEFPDITGLPEKVGVFGTMVVSVFYLLWYAIRHSPAQKQEWTPVALSERLANMQAKIDEVGRDLGKIEDEQEQLATAHMLIQERVSDMAEIRKNVTVLMAYHQDRPRTRRTAGD
jgi:hypothetical protein